ncbi:MAG TPA: hypothetical protein DCF70_05180 [Treponema sp.]|nr:hypothetical protein [Treponema sp.]
MSESLLIKYDAMEQKFSYPKNMQNLFNAKFDDRPLWEILRDNDTASVEDCKLIEWACSRAHESKDFANNLQICLTTKIGPNWYLVSAVRPEGSYLITLNFIDINEDVNRLNHFVHLSESDVLTNLYSKKGLFSKIEHVMTAQMLAKEKTVYSLVYFDITRFRSLSDFLGRSGIEILLVNIASAVKALVGDKGFAARIESDRFVFFYPGTKEEIQALAEKLVEAFDKFDLSFHINCNFGAYICDEENVSPQIMLDRAIVAQNAIKGSYSNTINFYDEKLRQKMITEQEITGCMDEALEKGQFVPFFQPQYDHSTGNIVGAETLVRWIHPVKGLISPGVFIPIFESNGFITELDLYIFEQTCRFIRESIDQGRHIIPISTNFSRYDIFMPDFIQQLETRRQKYNVDSSMIRIEITESAVVGGSTYTAEIVKKLHDCGYTVEMDDFGSGYSSLNVLKDIEFDIIKLDMKFMSTDTKSERSVTILKSIVNMAKWLNMPVIAEGVEMVEQANFLESIGCTTIQGYLYSKPLSEQNFTALIQTKDSARKVLK